MFNPAKYQPLVVFFDLEIGGLRKIYQSPNLPIDFELTLSKTDFPKVRFTLFDEAGEEVEPYIKDSRNPETGLPGGTFQFGYKGTADVESPKYGFNIQNVKPAYINNAFYLSVFGFLAPATPLMSNNQLGGTIEEIIDQFKEIHKFDDVIIEPKFGKSKMLDRGYGESDTTVKQEKRHVKLLQESDWKGLQRVLYYAVDEQGKSGYTAVPTCDESGKSILKIVRPQSSNADWSYKIQDKDSVVSVWQPDITYIPVLDSSDVQFNGHHKINGNTFKHSLNQEITKDHQELLGYSASQISYSLPKKEAPSKMHHFCAEQMEDQVTKGAIRARPTSSRSGYAGSLSMLYSHIRRWSGMNSATLVVSGDPRIQVVSQSNAISLVDIDFRTPQNYFNTTRSEKHYTSGKWMMSEVSHTINTGGFLTTMSMERASNIFEAKAGEQE